MHNCLTKEELSKLMQLKYESIQLSEEDYEINLKIENAENWQDCLSALTYSFSHILESKLKEEIPCQEIIDFIYELSNQIWLDLQEFNIHFVNYMMGIIRHKSLTLEENLIEIQNAIGEYRYE